MHTRDTPQSASTTHWRHVVPTQAGPLAFPTQCVLFWHCTHVIVATIQEDGHVGRVMGTGWGNLPPTAVANPIFVDVDGGGFKANGDLLDVPLPIK